MNRHTWIVGMAILLLLCCVEPFEPNIQTYQGVYVVDGELTNLPGPYEIKLSRSNEYGSEGSNRVSDALVTISDDAGNQVLLTETNPGIYSTVGSDFQGVPGREYKLKIEIEDAVLESDFIKMPEPVDIEDVYWEFEDRTSYAGVTGVQIYLDSQQSPGNSRYYAWEYEEYWRFEARYKNSNFPEICWDSSIVHPTLLGTTAGLSQNVIKNKSLYFVDNQTTRLAFRYSTLVKQYVLTETVYNFYKDLKTLNENSGSLFDPIPFSLEGNMNHITEPDVPVLGIFQVASVSQKRIFIDRDELPDELMAYDNLDYCDFIWLPEDDSLEIQDLMENLFWLPFDSVISLNQPPERDTLVGLASHAECFDCSVDGTSKEPDFWEE